MQQGMDCWFNLVFAPKVMCLHKYPLSFQVPWKILHIKNLIFNGIWATHIFYRMCLLFDPSWTKTVCLVCLLYVNQWLASTFNCIKYHFVKVSYCSVLSSNFSSGKSTNFIYFLFAKHVADKSLIPNSISWATNSFFSFGCHVQCIRKSNEEGSQQPSQILIDFPSPLSIFPFSKFFWTTKCSSMSNNGFRSSTKLKKLVLGKYFAFSTLWASEFGRFDSLNPSFPRRVLLKACISLKPKDHLYLLVLSLVAMISNRCRI